MAEATFTKNAVPISVERAGIMSIDLDTNNWSVNLKVFKNNQYDMVTLNRTDALALLGESQKAFFQTVIDTFQAAAVSFATGVTVTLNEIRASDLAYKVDAAPPVEE